RERWRPGAVKVVISASARSLPLPVPYRRVSQNSLQETGMKRITILSLIAVISFSLVAGDRRSVAQSPRPGLPTARPEDVGMSSERLGRIRTGVQRYVDSGMAPGVGTLAARRRRGLYVQDVRVPHGDSQTALSHDAH